MTDAEKVAYAIATLKAVSAACEQEDYVIAGMVAGQALSEITEQPPAVYYERVSAHKTDP